MLTSSVVISGPQSVMEPTVPGTTTSAHVSISLPMFMYGDSGTVQWATQAVAGGATPGDDFTASSGTASLSFMNPQIYVDIPIKYDTVSESPEPFQVVLSNATGSLAIMVGSTTINITDNNPPPPPPPPPGVPTVNFSGAASYFLWEGDNRVIHVVRDMALNALTVSYVIAQDSVAKSPDVTLLPAGSVTFAAGQTDATITLTAIDDSIIEVHELLKLSLVQYPAPNQGPGAYTVGSTGDSLTTINDNNEDIFSDLTVAWKTPDDQWQNSPDNEMLWQDDELRWTVTLPPEEVSFREELTSLKLLKRPHDNPTASWMEIAPQSFEPNPNNQAQFFIYAHPMVGDWDVTVHGIFGLGINAWLAAPKEEVVAQLAGITWQQHEYSDGRTDFEVGTMSDGDAVFPEIRSTEALETELHDKIDVKVKINWTAEAGKTTTVFVKLFDPDHASSANGLDTNGNTADDNIRAGGELTPGGHLSLTAVTFTFPETEKVIVHTIEARQPGNNFIDAGSGRSAWRDAIVFDTNGRTLLRKSGGGVLPDSSQTHLLTVWRTLNVEEDSLGPPDQFERFDGPSAIPGVGNDDAFPGDLGLENGGGDFGEPSLALLAIEFQKVNIRLRVIPIADDPTDNATFVHNLEDVDTTYGNMVRDFTNQSDRWAIQIFAAYEGPSNEDFDPPLGATEAAKLGQTTNDDPAPVNVYLETIRDTAANFPGAKDAETLRQRTVLHETMHRFGIGHVGPGIMVANTAITGSDAEVAVRADEFRKIITRSKP